MNKIYFLGKNKRLIRKGVSVFLIIAVLAGSMIGYNYKNKSKAYQSNDEVTKEMVLEAIRKKRAEVLSENSNSAFKCDNTMKDNKVDTNEQERIIVELKSNSVMEDLCEETGSVANNVDYFVYDKLDVKNEEKARDKKKNVKKQIEKITGNKVINQSEYLANTITIEATDKEIEKIEKLKEVSNVYETSSYESQVENSTNKTGVNYVREQQEYAYKGDETVVAVIDTGVNAKHPDMKLDDNAKVKYTKEEWLNKINLLGYGEKHPKIDDFLGNYVAICVSGSIFRFIADIATGFVWIFIKLCIYIFQAHQNSSIYQYLYN